MYVCMSPIFGARISKQFVFYLELAPDFTKQLVNLSDRDRTLKIYEKCIYLGSHWTTDFSDIRTISDPHANVQIEIRCRCGQKIITPPRYSAVLAVWRLFSSSCLETCRIFNNYLFQITSLFFFSIPFQFNVLYQVIYRYLPFRFPYSGTHSKTILMSLLFVSCRHSICSQQRKSSSFTWSVFAIFRMRQKIC